MKCDSVKVGMLLVKHPEVAQFLGGRLYDWVFIPHFHLCPHYIFCCTLRVKHPEVAQFLGGRLYDWVFMYEEI
ncbi:hypothetical protein IEQ34_013646 [Dendrobium chrysotoxum]|uniref:Uncharacterized protein n=1 Tax=Dendrobium chrysotoxum TaxID=161865 RepID=A0AAV7GQ95_DENCH|nr:hypothetical protein IEQ34_013646 [Dendrobium chrysotoxum]